MVGVVMRAAMYIPDETREPAAASLSFEQCYATHHAKVFHLGLRYGRGNSAWAEDLTHDVFVRLAETLHELHTLDDLGGWLYRVASNMAISKLRRQQSFWRRIAQKLAASEELTTPGADHLYEHRQLANMAMTALHRLPPQQRVVLSMKILDDKSQREIADTLCLSEGYVSKLVARGLRTIADDEWEVSE